MIWAIFLHLYQPPDQTPEVIKNVVEQSYEPIISILKTHTRGKINLNVNGNLLEQLDSMGYNGLIKDIKDLAAGGRIELVGSSKFHAFLPLLPQSEMKRQIIQGIMTAQRFFGDSFLTSGFFPTEMALSLDVVKIVRECGYKYILGDELSAGKGFGKLNWDKIYNVKGSDIDIFFLNRKYSDLLRASPNLGVEDLEKEIANFSDDQYLVTATDGEIFGHHYQSREKILAWVFRNPNITTVSFTELKERYQKREEISVAKASWETEETDLDEGVPYPLWKDPDNKIHSLEWKLTEMATSALEKEPSADPGLKFSTARALLDRGLHSCHYWWASASPYWNPDQVMVGLNLIIKAIRGSPTASNRLKREAEAVYADLIKEIWDWHWSGKAQAMIDEWDRMKGKK